MRVDLKFSVTPHRLYWKTGYGCLSDGLRLSSNHRKKYGEVDLFWITIEDEEAIKTKISAQQLSLELSKISSVKKVYDCATTYTEEVFETAVDNLE
ncbi:hypothetical protein BC938DRAFT_475080 [Jimgerdemannia flammicorona]|uniref:Uncharacterized protein n=1 Tax=Jimgerdemannia flammicorona TaxID=994334 RepID=A0A433QS12_9FUNG|nr:hypothetical protein BC938DRAFT_475080 [Jimgerdemannia flammicorona]